MALACHVAGCGFEQLGALDAATSIAAIVNHVAIAHPDQLPNGARDNRVKPPPLVRPTIDLGCFPAQWSDFLRRWNRFRNGSNIPASQLTTQAMECFSEELLNTADKAIFGFNTMNLDELLREVKAVAVQPVAVGILRATAHSARQAHGERLQVFAAKVRWLTTDCKNILPCPHAPVGEQVCTIVGCRGVDYTPEVIKDILLSGIYDHDVRREAIEDKTVNKLIMRHSDRM